MTLQLNLVVYQLKELEEDHLFRMLLRTFSVFVRAPMHRMLHCVLTNKTARAVQPYSV